MYGTQNEAMRVMNDKNMSRKRGGGHENMKEANTHIQTHTPHTYTPHTHTHTHTSTVQCTPADTKDTTIITSSNFTHFVCTYFFLQRYIQIRT